MSSSHVRSGRRQGRYAARRPAGLWLAGLATIAIAACGGSDDAEQPAPPPEAPASTVAEPPDRDRGADSRRDPAPGADSDADEGGGESTGGGSETTGEDELVQQAASTYVAALSARDGAAVCNALVAGALDAVELPKTKGGCEESIAASIGFRDPRGVPVFESAELVAFAGVERSGDSARVTATVVTDFADRDEPSIEDDVIYLVRDGGDWLIAKASPTLYRAIGAAEVPAGALAPPE